MHPDFEGFQSKFRVSELLVHRTAFWSWTVRTSQPTLGSGVLSLNRYALELHHATAEEMADLAAMVSVVERTIHRVFDHQIMNYLALMMVDRHTHFHVIPRYNATREFASVSWVDAGWPALPVLAGVPAANDALVHALRDHLRSNLVT